MTVCTPDAAKRSGKNFGEKIVEQYMRRRRWFVSASSLEQLGRTIAVREKYVDASGKADDAIARQITNALRDRLRRGEVKLARRGGTQGFRMTSAEERRRFADRGKPGRKLAPHKRRYDARVSIRFAS